MCLCLHPSETPHIRGLDDEVVVKGATGLVEHGEMMVAKLQELGENQATTVATAGGKPRAGRGCVWFFRSVQGTAHDAEAVVETHTLAQ